MGRSSRSVPFARLRLDAALRKLSSEPEAAWPTRLRRAQSILVAGLKTDEKTARRVTIDCFALAHRCAQGINQRTLDGTYVARRRKLLRVFAFMASSIRSAPAGLRRALDDKICDLVLHNPIDAESMEHLIDHVLTALAARPRRDDAYRLLRAAIPRKRRSRLDRLSDEALGELFTEANILSQGDYASLHPVDQCRVEKAIETERDRTSAAEICRRGAEALRQGSQAASKLCIADLITDFARGAADIWRRHGLVPGRAYKEEDRSYRGRFHRFLELVLIQAVEPHSQRYLEDPDMVEITAAELLVSDHHVRTALCK